jgi:hypothetical protein
MVLSVLNSCLLGGFLKMGRMWDSFLFRIGIIPRSYFVAYSEDVLKAFTAYEKFVVSIKHWADSISNYVGFDDSSGSYSPPGDLDEEDGRDMFQ